MTLAPGSGGNRFTQQRKEVYLAELRRVGVKPAARLAANVSASCVRKHRKRHPEFAQAEMDALVAHKTAIEEEIKRRGMKGVERPVYQGGKKVGFICEYDGRLLLEYARRHIPEYRQNVTIDQTMTHEVVLGLADLTKLPREGRDLLRRLLQCELDDDGTSEEEVPE